MDEVGAALIAIALVLCAVFVPSAFITGISGQFYRQFALTIAGATVISLIVSLTLSPALCALLLKPHDHAAPDRLWERPIRGFFRLFNRGFDRLGARLRLARRAGGALRRRHAGGLCGGHRRRPQRIPQDADRASSRSSTAAISSSWRSLPPGASLARTDAVQRRVVDIALKTPGVDQGGQHRRLLRRDLHQRAERRRGLPGARSVREARQGSAQVGRRHPARAVRRLAPIQEALDLRGAAAAGAGHRQRRRLPHDDRGPRRPRVRRRCRPRSTP